MKILTNYKMSKNKKIAQLLFCREKNKVCKISKKNSILKGKVYHPSTKVTSFYKTKSQRLKPNMTVKLCSNLLKIIQNLRSQIYQVRVLIMNHQSLTVINKLPRNKEIKTKLYLKYKKSKALN